MVINFPRVTGFRADLARFLIHGIATPSLVMLPMIAVAWHEWSAGPSLTMGTRALAAVAIIVVTVAMARPAVSRLRALV
jgi:hypothetical protein